MINDFHVFERIFWSILDCFRDGEASASCKKDSTKEIIVMRYDYLNKIFNLIADNYTEGVDWFNDHLEEIKNATESNNIIIPKPIDILDIVESYRIRNGIVSRRKVEILQ